jgi:replicative superfamily II helicase
MPEYVKMMQNKQHIESHLLNGLENCLNAEIAAGTITSVTEGIHWLRRSYFYQRMIQNPMHYGIKIQDI